MPHLRSGPRRLVPAVALGVALGLTLAGCADSAPPGPRLQSTVDLTEPTPEPTTDPTTPELVPGTPATFELSAGSAWTFTTEDVIADDGTHTWEARSTDKCLATAMSRVVAPIDANDRKATESALRVMLDDQAAVVADAKVVSTVGGTDVQLLVVPAAVTVDGVVRRVASRVVADTGQVITIIVDCPERLDVDNELIALLATLTVSGFPAADIM